MGKETKKMEVLHSNTLRGITDAVNSKGIQREDIVQVVSTDDGFILLYYI